MIAPGPACLATEWYGDNIDPDLQRLPARCHLVFIEGLRCGRKSRSRPETNASAPANRSSAP
eukprot:1489842-Pyramimonas_sp.AAC.2